MLQCVKCASFAIASLCLNDHIYAYMIFLFLTNQLFFRILSHISTVPKNYVRCTLVSCLAKYSRHYLYRLDRSFHGSAWPCYCGYAEIKRFPSISSLCLFGVTITPSSGMTMSAVSFITSSKITTAQSQNHT